MGRKTRNSQMIENTAKKRRTLGDNNSSSNLQDATEILPNEIWLKIFNHLSTPDILLNVALVCKHFRNLSVDAVKKLTIVKKNYKKTNVITRSMSKENSNKYHPNLIYEGLKKFKYLERISIIGLLDEDIINDPFDSKENLIGFILNFCPRIKEFYFENCRLSCESITNLARYGHKIQTLAMKYLIDFETEDCIEILIRNLKKVRHLNLLVANIRFNSKLLVLLADFEDLEALFLFDWRSISEESFIGFLNKRKDSLKFLTIDQEHFSDSWCQHLFKCHKLEFLCFSSHPPGPNISLAEIAQMISKLETVQKIAAWALENLTSVFGYYIYIDINFQKSIFVFYKHSSSELDQLTFDLLTNVYPKLEYLEIKVNHPNEIPKKEVLYFILKKLDSLRELKINTQICPSARPDWKRIDRGSTNNLENLSVNGHTIFTTLKKF